MKSETEISIERLFPSEDPLSVAYGNYRAKKQICEAHGSEDQIPLILDEFLASVRRILEAEEF